MRTRNFLPFTLFIVCLLTLFIVLPVLADPIIYITSVEYKDASHRDVLIGVDPANSVNDIHGYQVRLVDSGSGETITTQDFSTSLPLQFTFPDNTTNGDYFFLVKAKNAAGDIIAEASSEFSYERGVGGGGDNSISPVLLIGAGALLLIGIVAFVFTRSGLSRTQNIPLPAAPSGQQVTAEAAPVALHVQKTLNVTPAQSVVSANEVAPAPNHNVPPHAPPQAPRLDNQTIFVSYSRTDWIQFVEPMIKLLDSHDLRVWLDQHLLESGDDWLDKIGDALETCDRMILCLSPEALESRFVKMEYRYFFNHGKKIYPLVCRAAPDIPPELQGIQYYPYERLSDLIALLKRTETEPSTGA